MSAETEHEVNMSAKRLAWPAGLIAVAGFILTGWLVSAEVLSVDRPMQSDELPLHQLREPQKFREDMRLIPRGQPTPIRSP